MKMIGVIGGLSPESTVEYYNGLNALVKARLGGHHNAKILLSSLDFGVFVALKEKGDWDTQSKLLCDEAKALERAGADFIILATNTMHKMADQISASISIPFLHLADATANRILADQKSAIGLLGTRYTMELDFYKKHLINKGINVLVPNSEGQAEVSRIIYDELCHGTILPSSKAYYLEQIEKLIHQGAQGVILGCTEITMLVKQGDLAHKLYDTTQIHIEEAVSFAFS